MRNTHWSFSIWFNQFTLPHFGIPWQFVWRTVWLKYVMSTLLWIARHFICVFYTNIKFIIILDIHIKQINMPSGWDVSWVYVVTWLKATVISQRGRSNSKLKHIFSLLFILNTEFTGMGKITLVTVMNFSRGKFSIYRPALLYSKQKKDLIFLCFKSDYIKITSTETLSCLRY